jgi:NAD(P)-dependent dehydrogenase (short-subunit alcohol dehydrogenase family)
VKILVTGGAGFIGSAFVRMAIGETDPRVVNLDKLTYAGNLEDLTDVESDERFRFVQSDVCDAELVNTLVGEERPDAACISRRSRILLPDAGAHQLQRYVHPAGSGRTVPHRALRACLHR